MYKTKKKSQRDGVGDGKFIFKWMDALKHDICFKMLKTVVSSSVLMGEYVTHAIVECVCMYVCVCCLKSNTCLELLNV